MTRSIYKPDFKKPGTQAFSIALAVHLLLLTLYGFNIGGSGEGVIVSQLKIRFGEGADNTAQFLTLEPDIDELYVLEDESAAATEAVAESEPASGGHIEAAKAVEAPSSPKKIQFRKPGKRTGSSYGKQADGQIAAENYLQLLGYMVQEGAVVETPASLKGKAVLNLHLNREGYVVSYRLKRGSGHKILDNAAVGFAQKAKHEPLPAPPKSFDPSAKILKYDFTIYYD